MMKRICRHGGFTLIELTVVIFILGILIAVLAPRIFSVKRSAKWQLCKGMINRLSLAARSYSTEMGDYPPSTLSELPERLKLGSNGENEGIEAFVAALAISGISDCANLLDDMDGEGRLGNTDGDKANSVIGILNRRDQVEILDLWGNPFAYFHHRNYNKRQAVMTREGETQIVEAVRDPEKGIFMEPRRFQIISAGPDGIFGNEDDVANFEMPR